MSESPLKRMKLTETVPLDLIEHISSLYLPIKSSLRNRSVSKMFNANTEIKSKNLDFSKIYSQRRYRSKVVGIIESILSKHKGPEINRFVLVLNNVGMEDKILSWIKTCLSKNVQELVLDFSKSKKVAELQIDFSAMKTLTVLKLKWCKFVIPYNSPSGLRLLRTLSLMRTKVTNQMIEAIFNNCIHFESLELIQCQMLGRLNINAHNHKNFKSLSLYSMPTLMDIGLDAPTLECYKYEGYVMMVDFSKVEALKQAMLHYIRSYNWRRYDPSDMVLANMGAYAGVHALATTNIFLEALSDKYSIIDGAMSRPFFWFWNLKEFEIVFKAPTICTLYDIAEFMLACPNLESVVIDINDFTFEPGMYWEIHHKQKTENHNYQLKSIKFVDINGYKNHSHELDIIEFFLKNAQSLESLKLRPPTNPKVQCYECDIRRFSNIRRISPRNDVIQFIQN